MKRKLSVIAMLFVCLSLTMASGTARCDELTPEKEAAIREFLEVSGALKIGETMSTMLVNQLGAAFSQANPDIPPRAFEILSEEVTTLMHEEMVEKDSFAPMLIPIYHKYLTLDEIKQITAFYKTPAGKRSVEVMPVMMQEAGAAGAAWGQSITQKLIPRLDARFKKEGIDLK